MSTELKKEILKHNLQIVTQTKRIISKLEDERDNLEEAIDENMLILERYQNDVFTLQEELDRDWENWYNYLTESKRGVEMKRI